MRDGTHVGIVPPEPAGKIDKLKEWAVSREKISHGRTGEPHVNTLKVAEAIVPE